LSVAGRAVVTAVWVKLLLVQMLVLLRILAVVGRGRVMAEKRSFPFLPPRPPACNSAALAFSSVGWALSALKVRLQRACS
jgi:hypothetical protein